MIARQAGIVFLEVLSDAHLDQCPGQRFLDMHGSTITNPPAIETDVASRPGSIRAIDPSGFNEPAVQLGWEGDVVVIVRPESVRTFHDIPPAASVSCFLILSRWKPAERADFRPSSSPIWEPNSHPSGQSPHPNSCPLRRSRTPRQAPCGTRVPIANGGEIQHLLLSYFLIT